MQVTTLQQDTNGVTVSTDNSEEAIVCPPAQAPNQVEQPSWRTWPDLTVRIDHLPQEVTTENLSHYFSSYGNIASLDIFALNDKAATTSARITFEPPPHRAFWGGDVYAIKHPDKEKYPWGLRVKITVEDDMYQDWWVSRVCPDRKYPVKIVAASFSLDWGAMTGPTTMNIRKTLIASSSANDIRLEVQVREKRIAIYFPIRNRRDQAKQFRLVAGISQMRTVFHSSLVGKNMLVIPLLVPPQYFLRNDEAVLRSSSGRFACHNRDLWDRVISVAYHREAMQLPIAVNNNTPDQSLTELGRWTTFRLHLKSENDAEKASIEYLRMALEDFNVKVQESQGFKVTHITETMWDHLNRPPLIEEDSAAALLQMHSSSSFIALEFSVRYQLEVCVTRGVLNEHNVTPEFLERLAALSPVDATRRLEYLADQHQAFHDPMQLFAKSEARHYAPQARIPPYCTLVRKANITPTTIRFSSPVVEASNRVLRQYRHVQDRFLRVQFIEETEMGRMSINTNHSSDIWKRLIRALYHGIQIGDRIYEFLAFGSSQMRQCGVYFFCPTEHITCDDIRRWMGEFSHIKVVAKYAARLGQCFSTTREMRGIPVPSIKSTPDVERNGYCFTDGVGIISGFLARLVTEEMTLDVFNEPSAFQFRMSGCKGVLAVWPHAKAQDVYIRSSQEKFKTNTKNLEIIRCAKFANATLNRQTITVLECLGVPIQAFTDLLDNQIQNYEKAMVCNKTAVEMLTKYVDENQCSLVLAEFLQAGFRREEVQEPFVANLLRLWRSWSLRLLKEKARIQVEKSAFVLGCVDETGTLRGHSNKTEGSKVKNIDELPQIFLQLSDPRQYDQTKIITGVCIVGRNPSLHPGDIRVVQAVDIAQLRHLKDVVVFPSTGDRPVPNMLSGGDLDGDDFFVIWDSKLRPKEWNYPAMNYTAAAPLELDRDVNVNDLRDFFVNYLKNDVLPLIATSHLAFADKRGPKSPICLHLAEMHSKAVDFPKTGEPAVWKPEYNIGTWPHFMEKRSTYQSKKALGIIYDKVIQQNFHFSPEWTHKFDQRIITRFKLDNGVIEEAGKIKAQYDIAVRRILSQHNVGTEFELYTAWAMSKPPIGSDYKRQEELGREYDALKQRFRDICYEAAGGHEENKIDVFVAAMYKVTEEEVRIALDEGRQFDAGMPLISFPWIFPWVMTRIASGGRCNPKNSVLAAAHQRLVPVAQAAVQPEVSPFEPDKVEERCSGDAIRHDIGASDGLKHGEEMLQVNEIEHVPLNGMDRLALFDD